jgi:hypothetical protein
LATIEVGSASPGEAEVKNSQVFKEQARREREALAASTTLAADFKFPLAKLDAIKGKYLSLFDVQKLHDFSYKNLDAYLAVTN